MLAHDRGQPAELLGREIAPGDLHGDRREALLALIDDVASTKRSKRRAIAVGACDGGREGGRVRFLVIVEQQVLDREVALVDPFALELLVDHLTEGFDADLVDQDLDPGPGAIGPQPVLAIEDPQDRFGHLQVLAVVELDELGQRRGDAGHYRGAAADPDLDPADAIALARDEADVVDARDRDVLVGGGERGLDLARHQLRRRVSDEVADVGTGIGGDVEQLVGG